MLIPNKFTCFHLLIPTILLLFLPQLTHGNNLTQIAEAFGYPVPWKDESFTNNNTTDITEINPTYKFWEMTDSSGNGCITEQNDFFSILQLDVSIDEFPSFYDDNDLPHVIKQRLPPIEKLLSNYSSSEEFSNHGTSTFEIGYIMLDFTVNKEKNLVHILVITAIWKGDANNLCENFKEYFENTSSQIHQLLANKSLDNPKFIEAITAHAIATSFSPLTLPVYAYSALKQPQYRLYNQSYHSFLHEGPSCLQQATTHLDYFILTIQSNHLEIFLHDKFCLSLPISIQNHLKNLLNSQSTATITSGFVTLTNKSLEIGNVLVVSTFDKKNTIRIQFIISKVQRVLNHNYSNEGKEEKEKMNEKMDEKEHDQQRETLNEENETEKEKEELEIESQPESQPESESESGSVEEINHQNNKMNHFQCDLPETFHLKYAVEGQHTSNIQNLLLLQSCKNDDVVTLINLYQQTKTYSGYANLGFVDYHTIIGYFLTKSIDFVIN